MKRALLALAISLSLLPSSPAVADVNVDPHWTRPTVVLDATRIERPTVGTTTSAINNGPTKARRRIFVQCPVDAEVGTYGCQTYRPAEPDGDPRELTEGEILQAVREIGLPRLDVTIEPGDTTLVNAETNFYTDPEDFARSIDLLGFDVDLQASPVRYTWIHGDGTRHVTAKPGRPYPDLDVTHRYRKPAKVVRPRVDVTYRVRYRVDGGAWTTLGQTLTASGPTTDLVVNEAAPVLTAP